MTAPLPHGLIRVVSATEQEEPSDPADVVFERKLTLHNFWKVHATQARTTHDASSIRCRQLFWRVWGDRHLSLSLSQSTMMQLWLQCQQEFDITPFRLHIEDYAPSAIRDTSSSTAQHAGNSSQQPGVFSSSGSPSPSHLPSGDGSSEDADSKESSKQQQKARTTSRNSDSRPGLDRTLSGETSRKRSTVSSIAGRARGRPALPRKRSSQTTPQASDAAKLRRSIIKSPRSSTEDQSSPEAERRPSTTTLLAQMNATPATAAELPGRKIPAFELPSASSWQSVESHPESSKAPASPSPTQARSPLVDQNFRERFNQLRSSTNLAGMEKAMRKTGSVVRFADEVNIPEELRLMKQPTFPEARNKAGIGSAFRRTPSENEEPGFQNQQSVPSSFRPNAFQRHDSTGSVAAVSDDGSDENAGEPLQRTKSQLSLAIADLKRSRSLGEQDRACNNAGAATSASSQAITSPQIEKEQEELISGRAAKKKAVEEEKLLAMGRKDGVTRAGGVNLPKELTVKGKFVMPDNGYESPEEPLY